MKESLLARENEVVRGHATAGMKWGGCGVLFEPS